MRRLPTSPPSAASDAMADLNTDIRYIKGVGETRAKALHKLGIATLDDLLPRLDSLWEAGDHTAALKTLLEVRPVVDAFFDGVMVMCDDAALRANRLAMLNALGTRFARLADFAALQI